MPVFDVVLLDSVVVVLLLVSEDAGGVLVDGGVLVADPVVSDELGLVVLVDGLPLMPPLDGGVPGAGFVVVVVVVDVLLVSRPSVRLRSEQAPSASVARAAATATPIARVFI